MNRTTADLFSAGARLAVVALALAAATARADDKPTVAAPKPDAEAKEPAKADPAWADIQREADRNKEQRAELNKLKARAARAPRRRQVPGFVGPMFAPGMNNAAQARAFANARAAAAGAPMRNAADMMRRQQQFFGPNPLGNPAPWAGPGPVFGGPGWEVRQFQGPGASGFMMRWGGNN